MTLHHGGQFEAPLSLYSTRGWAIQSATVSGAFGSSSPPNILCHIDGSAGREATRGSVVVVELFSPNVNSSFVPSQACFVPSPTLRALVFTGASGSAGIFGIEIFGIVTLGMVTFGILIQLHAPPVDAASASTPAGEAFVPIAVGTVAWPIARRGAMAAKNKPTLNGKRAAFMFDALEYFVDPDCERPQTSRKCGGRVFQIRPPPVQGDCRRRSAWPTMASTRRAPPRGREERGRGMNLGFLGAGRMATALAQGCVKAGLVPPERVLASDPADGARTKFEQAIPGVRTTADNAAVLAESDTVVLAVKPQMMAAVLAGVRGAVEPRHLVISIAAGVTLTRLADALPAETRLVRRHAEHALPHRPRGQLLQSRRRGHRRRCRTGRPACSRAWATRTRSTKPQLDAVTGLSGSGPAFIYTVIEALAEGGAAMGLPPDLALKLAVANRRGRRVDARGDRPFARRASRPGDQPRRHDACRPRSAPPRAAAPPRSAPPSKPPQNDPSNSVKPEEPTGHVASSRIVDDKYVPLYRVMWVAATPHFCGDEHCLREGFYEIRLEQGESVWAKAEERDKMLKQLEEWQGELPDEEPESGGEDPAW